MKTKRSHSNTPSRLFILGSTLMCIAAGLQVASWVSESLESKPAKAQQSQKYQIPPDRPLIKDFNQKR